MNDSLLIKDFKENDLQRIRNLSTRKFSDKTKTSYGYTKEQIIYKEGDIFEENGKQYQIKDGIKISYSKLDFVRKSLQLPLSCPCCNKSMKHRYDKKFYSIHKKCFNCVIEYETKLRVEGKYEDYVNSIRNSNTNSLIKDLENQLIELISSNLNEEYVGEQGNVEKWDGGKIDKKQIEHEVKEFIISLRNA